jgi:hypothetical protein
LTIAGRVTGRIVAINADVIITATGRVERDVVIIGGRLDAAPSGVAGDVRVYEGRVDIDRVEHRIVVQGETEDERWYRSTERLRDRRPGTLRLVSASTYNRLEGLPILLGPALGHDLAWGRLTLEAMAILRSVDGAQWTSRNMGHMVKTELRIGNRDGVRVGARLFDVVDPVEPWDLSDSEVGLASFFLHRDYRDYFGRHGGNAYAALFLGHGADLALSYGHQRWVSRTARDPFTLFRDETGWRPNPAMDAGRFHLLNALLRYDTRNDDDDPWAGWHVQMDWEHGVGNISTYAPTSPFVRDLTPGGRTVYDRAFLDLRRYNRLSPDAQLNVRLVAGGWLGGDELPLQRRLSVGGPGTLPGNDFRRFERGTDYWACSGDDVGSQSMPSYPDGAPAQCERVMLAQIEFRGNIGVDPFGVLDEDRDQRRYGWGRDAQWVFFADAGRGWLVGPRVSDLQYPRDRIPGLGTFRADIGMGVMLHDLGLYMAKSLTEKSAPLNFFARLRPRF